MVLKCFTNVRHVQYLVLNNRSHAERKIVTCMNRSHSRRNGGRLLSLALRLLCWSRNMCHMTLQPQKILENANFAMTRGRIWLLRKYLLHVVHAAWLRLLRRRAVCCKNNKHVFLCIWGSQSTDRLSLWQSMVQNTRMQYHCIDCRKSHAHQDVKICPYNAKHVHPYTEHQFHLEHCANTNIVGREIMYASDEQYECLQGWSPQSNDRRRLEFVVTGDMSKTNGHILHMLNTFSTKVCRSDGSVSFK